MTARRAGVYSIEKLTAMAEGVKLAGLPAQPEDLSEATIRQLAHGAGRAETDRDDKKQARQVAGSGRADIERRTREIYVRLGAAVRGYYGRFSRELVAYGLKARERQVKRKRAKSKPGPEEG